MFRPHVAMIAIITMIAIATIAMVAARQWDISRSHV
jgi:hypothetical protein